MFGGCLRPFHIESYLSRHSAGGGGGAPAPVPQDNKLSSDDPSGWFLPGSELRPASDVGPVDGKPAYSFVAKNPTTSQLIYMAKNNFPDTGYFSIWAKGTGKFVMMVQRRAGGWSIYGQKQFDLTNDWKMYTIKYAASGYDPSDTIGFKIDTGGANNAPSDMLVSAPTLYENEPVIAQGPQPKVWKNVATDPLSNIPAGEVEVARNYILNPRMINGATVLGDAAAISVSAPDKSPLDTPSVAVRPAGDKTKSNAWFSYSNSSQVPTTGYWSVYVRRYSPGTSKATLFVQQRGGRWTKYSAQEYTINQTWQRLVLPYDISANPAHTGETFTRVMALTDGAKGINLTDSNLSGEKTFTIHIRPQNQMKAVARWAIGKNIGEENLQPQWQTITAKGGADVTTGVQFLYNQLAGRRVSL